MKKLYKIFGMIAAVTILLEPQLLQNNIMNKKDLADPLNYAETVFSEIEGKEFYNFIMSDQHKARITSCIQKIKAAGQDTRQLCRNQIQKTEEILKENYGIDVDVFAFPFTDCKTKKKHT